VAMMLILGGARSGKSSFAVREAESVCASPVMIATAEALDSEMADRIARHQNERGAQWKTIESPLDIAEAIGQEKSKNLIVIDCLTLWLSNLMHAGRNPVEASDALLMSLRLRDSILIANEVGLGIVPDNALARAFRDEAGRMNQKMASAADTVIFVAAGLPMYLKGQKTLDQDLAVSPVRQAQ
jgi:adenosylcobinamide kinase / adenosylcobinamide-phosphate guanylyltransferase